MDFNKFHFSESLEAEQSSSEKAKMSGEKQANPMSRQRQKDQMAQKMGPAQKSSTVYASEEYFHELRRQIEHRKAQDSARVDWRKDLEEAANERPQDEGDHPYVDVMPHTHKLPKKAHGNTKPENMPQNQQAMGEGLESGEEYHKRMAEKAKKPINPFPIKKSSKPMSRQQQRAKQMAAAPKSKDNRTPSQRMADAYASPRKGPGGQRRAD
jgi:hypothetical protein